MFTEQILIFQNLGKIYLYMNVGTTVDVPHFYDELIILIENIFIFYRRKK